MMRMLVRTACRGRAVWTLTRNQANVCPKPSYHLGQQLRHNHQLDVQESTVLVPHRFTRMSHNELGTENSALKNLIPPINSIPPPTDLPEPVQRLIEMANSDQKKLKEPEQLALITQVTDQIGRLGRDNQVHLLAALSGKALFHINHMKMLAATLDTALVESLREMRSFDSDKLNQALDLGLLWCQTGLSRKVAYFNLLSKVIFHNIELLDLDGFRKFLYILNIQRGYDMQYSNKLIQEIKRRFSTFSSNDIGLFCATLFKTQTRINDIELVNLIANNVNAVELSDVLVSSVCKILRYSKNYATTETPKIVRQFIARSCEQRNQLGTQTLAHLCLLSYYYLYDCEPLLQLALERISNEPKARLKDIISIIRSCAEFDYRPSEEIMNKIIGNLETEINQMRTFPTKATAILSVLASFSVYPEELIKFVFSAEYVDLVKEITDTEVHFGALYLHTSVGIEAPHLLKHCQWTDGYLKMIRSSTHRIELQNIMALDKTKDRSSFTGLFRKLYLGTRQIYGDQVAVKHTLPFVFHPDIIITRYKRQNVYNNDTGDLNPAAAKDCIIVVLKTISQYANTSFTKFSRMPSHKIELLRKQGFTVIEISFFEIADLNILRIARKMSFKLSLPIQS